MEVAEINVDELEVNRARDILENLSAIFTDADPAYLQQLSIDYALNTNSLNLLIENHLTHKNYPKKKDEIAQSEKIIYKNSSHRNSVEAFLQEFPDPLNHFKQRKVGDPFAEPSKLYLKAKFPFSSVKTIDRVMKENENNLTLAYFVLSDLPKDRQTKRSRCEIQPYDHIANKDFLDEVYFLDNKENIDAANHLIELKFQAAKANNELLVCQCCFEEVFDTFVLTCMDGHIFCKDCVKKGVETYFSDGKTKLQCFELDCTSEFHIDHLKGLVTESLYKKMLAKIQESEVKAANISGICFCPYCEYAEIPADGDKVFKCKTCLKESCRFCQEESHIPLSCKEYQDEKSKDSARKNIEDKMTEALVRECYKCKKKFIKQDGCNKMQCVCGALMCYVCKQPIKDYSHFQNNNINNPSTSKATLCPLYSNNDVLHDHAVIEAARTAAAEIKKDNPNLEFNEKELLKGLKRKSLDNHRNVQPYIHPAHRRPVARARYNRPPVNAAHIIHQVRVAHNMNVVDAARNVPAGLLEAGLINPLAVPNQLNIPQFFN